MIETNSISKSNPWWVDPLAIDDDKKIREWEESTVKHDSEIRRKINYDFEPDNTVIYSLRGPRQVGKTTLIKLQIRDFLRQGVDPLNICYYALDIVNTIQDVVDLIETYLKISKQKDTMRRYIFLDEVSSIRDWQKGVKWLVDRDVLKNCTLLATGSQSMHLKNATERLPGRKGEISDSYDKVLLPMTFAEYVLMDNDIKKLVQDNDLVLFKNKNEIFKKLLDGEVDEKVEQLRLYQNELNRLLGDYMLTGGIPKIMNGFVKLRTIQENNYTNYLDSIRGQWYELKKNEILLKQFGGAIIKGLSNSYSWSNLSKEAEFGSPNTAQDYAHTLHHLFVLSIIHHYGRDKKIPMIQKNRKFYFRDPFLFHIFNGWLNFDENFDTSYEYLKDDMNCSKLIEGIVADHLIRWSFSVSKKKQTHDYYDHVFYWKDDKNREVDFILNDGDRIEVPIEVKYRNKLNHKELAPMVDFLDKTGRDRGLVASKASLEVNTDYVVIPTSLLLLLM